MIDKLQKKDFLKGVRSADRKILARTITMLESTNEEQRKFGLSILEELMPETGNSIRIGVTGVPGGGKSTLIEALGVEYCKQDKKVAVLAIDPSSKRSGGSILGDKTRMDKLSRLDNAFIRPSPSGNATGGVALRTRETMLLCEAAGFDIILIETIGVGQGETELRNLVDFFLLVMITGAGDELQSIKKGIIELSDAIVINKADGDNKIPAQNLAEEFNQVLHYLPSYSKDWQQKVLAVSARSGENLLKLLGIIGEYTAVTRETGSFFTKRDEQIRIWLQSLVEENILARFLPQIQKDFDQVIDKIKSNELSMSKAVQQLLSEL